MKTAKEKYGRFFRISRWMGLLLLPVMAAADSPEDIIRKVEQAIASGSGFRIQFEEIYLWSLTGEENRLQGKMLLGQNNRFRIETGDQTIVSDGHTLWTYSQPDHRVLIDRIEETDQSLLPMQIFFRFIREYEAEYRGEETLQGMDCHVLKFRAKKEDELISEIMVWVDDDHWLPRRIEQTDLSGNQSVYVLKEIETADMTDASRFTFSIPDGADVIDMQQ